MEGVELQLSRRLEYAHEHFTNRCVAMDCTVMERQLALPCLLMHERAETGGVGVDPKHDDCDGRGTKAAIGKVLLCARAERRW